jgi:hypothetical protein
MLKLAAGFGAEIGASIPAQVCINFEPMDVTHALEELDQGKAKGRYCVVF